MGERFSGVKASVGFFSDPGPRERNEDFAGAVFGSELAELRHDVVAAIADGIGSAKGGRVAAETAVRGFLDGFTELPETMEVRNAGPRVLAPLNSWIHGQGRRDTTLAGMGCTFTALVLRGRTAHVLHVGDTRAYRLSDDRLTILTTDHVRQSGPGRSGVLYRALGVESEVRLDYSSQPMARHDRFLLCSDGVHGFLGLEVIADILREQQAASDAARALVHAALQNGGTDNSTAMVIDVVDLPEAGSADVTAAMMQLPIIPAPQVGETVDGFVLNALISDGRYTRLFLAVDEAEGGEVVAKFPKREAESIAAFRKAFAREAWVGARVNSPWVGRIIALPPGRQTSLYTVMPYYVGELLQTRIAHAPMLGLEEGRNIAIKLARAVDALHRADIIHRDIKPDNVILGHDGSLKLIDLGVVRVPGLEDEAPENIPGTAGYMAPEMYDGEAGNEATDIFALGVTIYRAFGGEFPYGNPEAGPPSGRPKPLSNLRPDLPGWLEAALARAIAIDPAERFSDVVEFAVELESGPARASSEERRPRTLYERSPVRFWQGVAALLAAALIWSLLRH
ncbi:MAG TPA: protein kinase [Pseudolabrys sp.]|nr:protein kinase [Pseudolabrys sp.]